MSVLRSADDSLGAVDGAPAAGEARSGPGAPGTSASSADDAPMSPLPGLADIDALVAQFQSAGLRIDHRPALGADGDVSPRVGLTAYRIVQEALTNVLCHAGPGAGVTLELTSDGADLTVVVDDDGMGTAPAPVSSGGHGLVGMRERAAAAGGRVQAGPAGGRRGWRVEAVLPLVGRP